MQRQKIFQIIHSGLFLATILSVVFSASQSYAGPPGPGPGPGPAGGPSSGPPDPPRDTPGLDPITLSALAAGGYASYRMYRTKQGK